MSARSAGRIAAIVTARHIRSDSAIVAAVEDELPREGARRVAGVPSIGGVAPTASAGEVGALQSIVSYIPSEALTIYIAGIAAVNLVQDQGGLGEKVAAAWILWVIASVANVSFVWLGFKARFSRLVGRELTVRQTRPLAAGIVVTTLAFFVFALAIPGGIAVSDLQWLPLVLLVGAAVVVGAARLLGIAPLQEDDEDR